MDATATAAWREVLAREIMLGFAERTGLTSDATPERYLWTDAFAVCNFLALGEVDLAQRLIDQVHSVLGRHRSDDQRADWLSGLTDAEAAEHPTIGGLRIGKKLPERGPDEPFDERMEWDRDGQYFHHLTRWMHALDRAAQVTNDGRYNVWARELCETAHRSFTYFDPVSRRGRRMYWKMNIDLSRPSVASMGHHDPLDGFVTCLELDATAATVGMVGTGPSLPEAATDFRQMIPPDLTTADPLGLGGLLTDALRLTQLAPRSAVAASEAALRDRLLDDAADGLALYSRSQELRLPADYRLAFRELGLSIGLHAAESMPEQASAAGMAAFLHFGREIEAFWLAPENQAADTWRDHRNIKDVMLATSLAPAGYLGTAETPPFATHSSS